MQLNCKGNLFAYRLARSALRVLKFAAVLWVDETAPNGDYWAEFRLTDLSGAFGNSGRFFIDVRNVPEPVSIALVGMALLGMVAKRR